MTSGSLSLPSKQVISVDAEEISNLTVNFIYNFFTPDEGVNDSGNFDDATTTADDLFNEVTSIQTLNNSDFSVGTINPDVSLAERSRIAAEKTRKLELNNKIIKFTPRYVELNWNSALNRNYISSTEILPQNFLVDNKDKILKEEDFWGNNFTNVLFQDVNADKKTTFFLKRIIQAISDSVQSPIANVSPKILQDIRTGSRALSGLDLAGFLNTETSNEVNQEFLRNTTVQFENNGYIFPKKNQDEILKTLSKVATSVTIANKFVYSLAATTLKNTTTVFTEEIGPMLQDFLAKQNAANTSTALSQEEYDIVLDETIGISVRELNNFWNKSFKNAFVPEAKRIGFMIEKTEYPSDGAPIVKDTIFIQNTMATKAKDSAVKYGTRYGYKIRSIVKAKILVEDNDPKTNNFYVLEFLFASKASESIMIDTEEYIAPPEVADFKIGWDYYNKAARLTWSFPVNPQRDIKYFQIFRRSSINEPFELIKMYDFNDSLLPFPLIETPDSVLIEKLTSPKSYYLDKEFKKDSNYIYTICAIDAHGYSSNYCIQFQCYFDKYANKMIVKPICLSGCPKIYPNANLIRDAFVDTIRDSGHKQIKIMFNPEYLNVNDSSGNSLKVLRYAKNEGDPETKKDSYYKFQLINTDLQTQEVITIKLFDEIIRR
jgi:hypothetical protein